MSRLPVILLVFVVALAAAMLLRKLLSKRPTAEELERRRRDAINAKGKLGDGEIVDVESGAIVFSYNVSGVGYTAAQDVSALVALLPSDRMSMIGPASVKFDPRNPANSIVLCEAWSGLRDRETNSRLA
jgi:hypothetical protein